MIGWLVVVVATLVLAFVLLSPLESLRWWSRTGQREVRQGFAAASDMPEVDPPAQHVVYLSGIGTLGGEPNEREDAWLDSLREALPDAHVTGEVFPYSTSNSALVSRPSGWLWRRLEGLRDSRFPLLVPFLIEFRNVTQVLVSADPRYGPTFNLGLAHEIWRALLRGGYRRGSSAPVTLIGFSGGAQMALGAAWYLERLGVEVHVISIGGVFGDDPGLDRTASLWHLDGTRDHVHRLGPIAFPGRWPGAALSPYGKAKREGRVRRATIGPMRHSDAEGYFGRDAVDDRGRSHASLTRDAVVAICEGREPDGAHPSRAPLQLPHAHDRSRTP